MRPALSLLIYLAAVFLGGALLAPWLYGAAQGLAAHLPALHWLAGEPFHRFVSRALLGVAVIGLWPLARSVGFRAWNDVGLGNFLGQGRRLAAGFALGLVSLALVVTIGLLAGARQVTAHLSAAYFFKHLFNAGLSALAVSVVEELVFRGVIFGALARACRWPIAALVSGVLYALPHFFSRPAPPDAVRWDSGLLVLAQMSGGLAEARALVPGALALTLAGVILALALRRTGGLHFSIGLHAGWIFWIKTATLLAPARADSAGWLWGGARLVDGWLTVFVLAATALAVHKLTSPNPLPANARDHEPEKLA